MDTLTVLREHLLGQAYLFDQPETYAAGVDDAFAAMEALLNGEPVIVADLARAESPIRRAAN